MNTTSIVKEREERELVCLRVGVGCQGCGELGWVVLFPSKSSGPDGKIIFFVVDHSSFQLIFFFLGLFHKFLFAYMFIF